ncbi:NADH-quinone oxidoreductase subunit NuoN [Oceanibacterium hippocampi]|uniref:NADH-quinone oxidoreductase subunit N n=1 Tax=Oceanibacterium hippocampi TaxID=745714 RepID=A0A1Y5T3Y8_9PROT|nr:NADH-quinone oxidoreductase subunit NuoN [Oceanibacterium hippocampi]SLN53652.1 NADH-quinone oxidoreductase subunit N [Oceanibacterium hippocampi]
MDTINSLNISAAGAELFLAVAVMVLLMLGAFRGNRAVVPISWLSVLSLVFAAFLVMTGPSGTTLAFGDLFITDDFARFAKVLSLLAAATAIVMSMDYIQRERMARFEFPILMLLASLGMLAMISANDLISLYLGMELMSLSLYVTAAFKRDSQRATEAGLKYFVLGVLSSGLLLYGCSLIYGFTGSTNFTAIAEVLEKGVQNELGLLIGLVFLISGLAFKVSAVPFHMWTPDVYEGVPTPVTAFFAVAPKVAAIALFFRTMLSPFGEVAGDWQQIIIFISIGSMLLGAFAAIGQRNIKRLMAYSSIGHMGYALIGLAAGTAEGVQGVLVYMTIYAVMNIGAFACILSMRRKDGMVEGVADLAGLAKSQPKTAFAFAAFLFSLAGIPPLAGFFGKLYIFLAAVNSGLYALAVIGVVTSVVGAFYYLNIIKVMYFDEPSGQFESMTRVMGLITTVAGVLTVFYFVYPGQLVAGAGTAAAALFP